MNYDGNAPCPELMRTEVTFSLLRFLKMAKFFVYQFVSQLIFLSEISSLKVWIPNTNVNNSLNWDKRDTPKDCDSISFQAQTEIVTYWNIEKLVITGLSLPGTGDVVFQNNIKIQFRNKEKCSVNRGLKYIRHQVKGWLDPNNWMSDSEYQWLPHVERVPCTGEKILFPPKKTFAVQLPSILVPVGEITFDTEKFSGDTWSEFLRTELGFKLFKGPDDIRSMPWRNGVKCSGNKCICGRNPYTIRDGQYRDTESHIYEEAVCLYAMPKCKISDCYSPVVPEGHCCGICGAVIKIKDTTKEGLNISLIKAKIEKELKEYRNGVNLKTYVGRTKDGNIQIVVIADRSDDTIKSHAFANLIQRKLIDQKLKASITSHLSGLKFSNYLFNRISGIVFGTLMGVLTLFIYIFYIYVILPNKKFLSSGAANPFMFARFDNTPAEENLEFGIEPVVSDELPQAFDNPMYSGSTGLRKESGKINSSDDMKHTTGETLKTSETTATKEYSNPVYNELEKTKELEGFQENLQDVAGEFSEIKF